MFGVSIILNLLLLGHDGSFLVVVECKSWSAQKEEAAEAEQGESPRETLSKAGVKEKLRVIYIEAGPAPQIQG